MIPVIIPINTQTKVNCIIQDGKQFCEEYNVSKKEGSMIALGILGFMIWVALWIWISMKLEDEYDVFPVTVIIFGAFGIPLLIIGLVGLFG